MDIMSCSVSVPIHFYHKLKILVHIKYYIFVFVLVYKIYEINIIWFILHIWFIINIFLKVRIN